MKYAPPYGSTDSDASYINGTPSSRGSVIPAAAVENPQREIVNALIALGVSPKDENNQLGKAIISSSFKYNPSIDYNKPRPVIGSDNYLYLWKKNNGPSTVIIDPVNDSNEEYWIKYNPASKDIVSGNADTLGIVKLSDEIDDDKSASDSVASTPLAVMSLYQIVIALEAVVSGYQNVLTDTINRLSRFQEDVINRLVSIELKLNSEES